MKKTIFTSALLLLGLAAMAQQPVITFSKTEHDFGTLVEGDAPVSTIFEFKNEGMEPLVITEAKASCGCTVPVFTKTPVEPGATGTITVTYNSNRVGTFNKQVTVTSNASTPKVILRIKGNMVAKPAKPVDKYPVKMGELSLNTNSMQFGTIMKGSNTTRRIEYANQTDHPITVDVLTNDKDNFLIPNLSVTELQPGEAGTLNINWDADKCKNWGNTARVVYVVVNGKRLLTDEYKVTLEADIEEDFSKWTATQKQQGAIAELPAEANLGTIKANQTTTQKVALKNVGINPLEVRGITNDTQGVVQVAAPKGAIKGGKSANLVLTVNTTDLKPGTYRRQVELLTNDHKQPKRTLRVVWVVE